MSLFKVLPLLFCARPTSLVNVISLTSYKHEMMVDHMISLLTSELSSPGKSKINHFDQWRQALFII